MYFVGSQPRLQAMLALKQQLSETMGHPGARLSKTGHGQDRGLKVILALNPWPAEPRRQQVQRQIALFVRQQYSGKDREELTFVQVDLVAELGSGCDSRPVLDSHKEPFRKRKQKLRRPIRSQVHSRPKRENKR